MGESKVRVLVVDDFEPFRRFISVTLGRKAELQIIGEASDGLEAVQKAEALQPDLIVLDIGLPGISGIEAARRIRQLSPQSKVLFVSQESSADIVQGALGLGALGYVVKANVGSELLPAVAVVLEGGQFISSELLDRRFTGSDLQVLDHVCRIEALPPPIPRQAEINPSHEVQFYSDDAAFLVGLTHSIEDVLKAGNAVIVLATEPHRKVLAQRLRADGIDSSATAQGSLIVRDAAETLSKFMEYAGPHRERFRSTIVPLMRDAEIKHQAVMVFGEMVAVLFADGRLKAALELERLWNELAQTHIFQLRCAYPMSDELKGEPYAAICAEHGAVLTA